MKAPTLHGANYKSPPPIEKHSLNKKTLCSHIIFMHLMKGGMGWSSFCREMKKSQPQSLPLKNELNDFMCHLHLPPNLEAPYESSHSNPLLITNFHRKLWLETEWVTSDSTTVSFQQQQIWRLQGQWSHREAGLKVILHHESLPKLKANSDCKIFIAVMWQ